MEHVLSVRPTGKFPEKVENLKRWSRFPGWNFRTECRVPLTFLVVCTSSRSTVGHPATYRGLRPNGTTFYQSEIPLLLPPKFPGFFPKWKAPVENLKRWSCFPGWNFRTESRVPFTFLVVCTSSRSTVGHRDVPGFTTKWNNFLPIGNSTFATTEISGFFS